MHTHLYLVEGQIIYDMSYTTTLICKVKLLEGFFYEVVGFFYEVVGLLVGTIPQMHAL